MSSAGPLLAETAIVLSIITAGGTLLSGFRRRAADAAKRPFLAGQVAIKEAETALRMKDARLEEMAQRESQALAELEQAKAANAAQQQQIAGLYADLGKLQAHNAKLEEGARLAAEREERDRLRITGLEERLADVMNQLGMGQ